MKSFRTFRKNGKCSGQAETVCAIFFVLFLLVLIMYELQKYQFNATKTYTEDALAMSNLASAVIDIEEYGLSNNMIIADADSAFETYKRALKVNMGLNDSWESADKAAIAGEVKITDYIIYNVRGADVEVIRLGQSPARYRVPGGLGTVTAPNGRKIAATSVYSRITFPVEGIWGITLDAVKDNLVDVVNGVIP